VKILSAQGIKSRNQKIHLTGDRQDDALPEARCAPPWHGRGNAAWAAFPWPCWRARPGFGPGVPPGLLSPGDYKYPPGVRSWEISRVRASCCNLTFRIV